MGELYRLDFANGKSYVGITMQDANRRLVKHRHTAKRSTKGVLYQAWRKHGEPALVRLAIIENTNLAATEVRAIKAYNTGWPHGYNATPGGHIVTPEMAKRIADAQRGRRFSLEHRTKLAMAKVGTKRSSEIRAKMSASQRARRAAEGCTPQRWRYP